MTRHRNWRLYIFRVMGLLAVLLMMLPATAQDDTTQTIHVVNRGDTLFRVAQRYGVSMNDLIEANSITNPSRILPGQELIIPNFDPLPDTVENALVAGTPTTYVVQPGDTLGAISQRFGMTIDQLMLLNNIYDPNQILRGSELMVWELANPTTTQLESPTVQIAPQQPLTEAPPTAATNPVTFGTPVPQNFTYVVQPGDQLGRIAERYGVGYSQLIALNNITNPNQIMVGQSLIIPYVGDAPNGAAAQNVSAQTPPNIVPAPPTLLEGKQVVVDLSDQMVYAYQDGALLRSVLVSTGLPATPTVQGDYRVYHILEAQRMVGPGYDLPGVPYVMYFYQGYALHGTYWHNNFGQPMSHGCVNLPTPEAEWFFRNFVELGTAVHVRL
jgi:LysM repeat protein